MKTPTAKIPVALLGATGTVGQRMLALLEHHPWFELQAVMASSRSAGRPYGEVVEWAQTTSLPGSAAELMVGPCEPADPPPLVFSALDASVARDVEQSFAQAGCVVVSNAMSHRMDRNVPLLVPEVNADHLELASHQDFGAGAILTNPNCTTIGLTLALAPLHREYGVERVHVVTLQALSGAGIPGLPALAVLDNVIPYIPGEVDKLRKETPKVLGTLKDGELGDARITVSAQCNRVPVSDGHMLCVSVGLQRSASPQEVETAMAAFRGPDDVAALPSAPRLPIHVLPEEDAPQPRLHRNLERGMALAVGQTRQCPLLDVSFVCLSHNTLRGAAGGSMLVAELAVSRGLVSGTG